MPKPPKADPAIYAAHRTNAINYRIPGLAPDALHAILMDWPVNNGMTTILAAADGTASIFLSNGGSFLGGSDSAPAIRSAALHAVRLAERNHGDARPTLDTSVPTSPNAVFFYFVYESGILLSRAKETTLRDGSNHLQRLGAAMQSIVTQYRLWHGDRHPK